MNLTNEQTGNPRENETDHTDPDKQLKESENINSDEDLHEAEAGNRSETEAQKSKLAGSSNDLIAQPDSDDDDRNV